MKKILMVIIIGFVAQTAQSNESYYGYERNERSFNSFFKTSLGVSNLESYQDSLGEIRFLEEGMTPFSLGYGVSMGHVAYEGEMTFAHNTFDYISSIQDDSFLGGDISTFTMMMNAYLKSSRNNSNFYIGAGMGILTTSLEGLEQEMSGSSLAVQVILGAELKLGRAGLFIEYRAMQSLGLELENEFAVIDFDYLQSGFQAGAKFYF